MVSSSIPARVPSSASTDTLCWCANSATCLLIFMFSSNGSLLASIMTDEKPISIARLHMSKLPPWSRCNAILLFGVMFAPRIIPISMSSPIYFKADSDTAKITGLFARWAASSIAVNVSMLYKLNAGIA